MNYAQEKISTIHRDLDILVKLLLQHSDEEKELAETIKSLRNSDDWMKMYPQHFDWLSNEEQDIFLKGVQNVIQKMNKEFKVSSEICTMLYHVISLIFEDAVPEERLRNFHDVIEKYYDMLKYRLHGMKIDLTAIIPIALYEQLVKLLNSFVKIVQLRKSCDGNNKDEMKTIKALIFELNEFFKCPHILREDCFRIIEHKLMSKNFELSKFSLDSCASTGFMGEYFKLSIFYKYEDQNDHVQLFTKCMLTDGKAFGYMAAACFMKEDFFYKTYFSKLHDFGLGKLLTFLPECYFVRNNDVVVLEDLSLAGYSVIGYQTFLNYEELLTVIKCLAKLHACSILFEEKHTKISTKSYRLNQEYGKYLIDVNFSEEKCGDINRTSGRSIYQIILKKFPDIPSKITLDQLVEKAEKLFSNLHQKLGSAYKYRSVISHGDLWMGNLMFKVLGGEISCKLIDFQLIRYCPPALDLWFFLYLNSTKDTRDAFTNDLFNEYYDELSNNLNSFDVDINEIYSREVFFESCNSLRLTALCHSMAYASILFFPKHLIPVDQDDSDTIRFYLEDRTAVLNKAFEHRSYTRKIRSLVEDLYKLCEEEMENDEKFISK